MNSPSLLIENLIKDFQARGWKSEPMKASMEICREHPDYVGELVMQVLEKVPVGGTFFDAALSFLPNKEWPAVIELALETLHQEHLLSKTSGASETVITFASLQCVENLHPHLKRIFTTDKLFGSIYDSYPWRDSGETEYEWLRDIFEQESMSPVNRRNSNFENRKLRAWGAMLETRSKPVLAWAIAHADEIPLSLYLVQSYLHRVGVEVRDDSFSLLYSPKVRHLCFSQNYLPSKPEHIGANPTWDLNAEGEKHRFGGELSQSTCRSCGKSLANILTLSPVPADIGVTGLPKLTLATCLSCLGWDESPLFYEHDEDGEPRYAGTGFKKPQFPSLPLLETIVQLAETPARWQWQEWAISNGRENLNRLGGHPCWVQDAEYPTCPCCSGTMKFLLQLDSDLPQEDDRVDPKEGRTFDWGSGGLAYAFWCDGCRVSAFLWQCT